MQMCKPASALQAEGRGFESLSSHDRDHPKQDGFLCREHSSVGLERLLDKQEVSGSNPLVPTSRKAFRIRFGRLFCRHCGNAAQEKDGYAGIRLLFIMKQGRAICRSPVRGCCRGRLSPERRREAQRRFRTCRCTP